MVGSQGADVGVAASSRRIEAMPRVLTWCRNDDVDIIHDGFLGLVSDHLGYALDETRRRDPEWAELVGEEIAAAPADDFYRVLMAPDTTRRILWTRDDVVSSVADFVHRALQVEQGRRGRTVAVDGPMWSALGDVVVLPGGQVKSSPVVAGAPPIDLDSPTVSSSDPLGQSNGEQPWRPLRDEDRGQFLDNLATAMRGIQATNPLIGDFVRRFVKVLVVQANDQTAYSAYSAGKYVGRTTLSNPQLVEPVDIAESVVHEATHSLLYMQIPEQPWGIDQDVFEERKAVSPWSGRPLPLTTYLHACFVWYGLVNFWSQARGIGCFPQRRVEGRLARAALGFLKGPLFANMARDEEAVVAPDVHVAIEELQAAVVGCL
jgi:hypothetical protein